MCLPGALLRSVLVVLLLTHSCGKPCNLKEILGSYSEVIFVELQKLNLTGSLNTSLDRDPCRSGKARGILASIYNMTQQVRCQWTGTQQSHLVRPLKSMRQLIIQKCSDVSRGKRATCSAFQKVQGKKKKRKKPVRLIKVIKSLITCWQKLQSVYMLSK